MTRKWQRQTSYGGLVVENIVQAISRDILATAMKRCEETRIYSPILTIHDEIVCEAQEHLGDVKEFEAMVGQAPEWAHGCPVAAEGWAGKRYRK
jgi:DNA polymerase